MDEFYLRRDRPRQQYCFACGVWGHSNYQGYCEACGVYGHSNCANFCYACKVSGHPTCQLYCDECDVFGHASLSHYCDDCGGFNSCTPECPRNIRLQCRRDDLEALIAIHAKELSR